MKNKEISDSHVGYKVRLFPTRDQEKMLYEYFGLNRFVYNLGIDIKKKHYKDYLDGKEKYIKLLEYDLYTRVQVLKKTDKYSWLNNYSWHSITLTLKDVIKAYDNYFSNNTGYPRYKSKTYSKKQFPIRSNRLNIDENMIKIPSIGKIKYCNSYGNEILGTGDKNAKTRKYNQYCNARISFDGNYFYLSFTIPKDQEHTINSYKYYAKNSEWQEKKFSDAIGIDVGLKNEKWIVDSTGRRVERPNSDILNKKISRLQRKYQRQKDKNLSKNSSFMEQHPNGSKNMQKTLAKINKCFNKITNRRKNVVYEYSNDLLNLKPKAIVMESISVKKLMVNDITKNCNDQKRQINHLYNDAALYESMLIIERKMINNGIPVIRADETYPSSQLCSCCGYRQNIGRKNIYRCPECGTIIDRDLNAAINLANLAY